MVIAGTIGENQALEVVLLSKEFIMETVKRKDTVRVNATKFWVTLLDTLSIEKLDHQTTPEPPIQDQGQSTWQWAQMWLQ
ncbi:hypothetical protein Tco_0197847 [Tanacetum coccineum]